MKKEKKNCVDFEANICIWSDEKSLLNDKINKHSFEVLGEKIFCTKIQSAWKIKQKKIKLINTENLWLTKSDENNFYANLLRIKTAKKEKSLKAWTEKW